jgi:lysophospholipase L1-like esterase
VYHKNYTTERTPIRILVNGVPLTDLMQVSGASGAGSLWYYRVDLENAVVAARITVEIQGIVFGGVVPEVGGVVAHPGASPDLVLVQGDSNTDGSAENTGGASGTWLLKLAHKRGWQDAWNVAIGGTGYTAPGTAVTILDRMADVLTVPATMHMVFAGGNDGTTSITTAVTSYVDQYQAAQPTVPLYLLGVAPTAYPAPQARIDRDAEIESVAIAKGTYFISPITGKVRNGSTLVTTLAPLIPDATAEAAYIGADGVHMNDVGHQVFADWLDSALTILSEPLPVRSGWYAVINGVEVSAVLSAA